MVAFLTDQSMSRPEIRQYLTKLYGLDITRVKTLNRRPRYGLDLSKGRYRKTAEPGRKVAYVFLRAELDPFFQRAE